MICVRRSYNRVGTGKGPDLLISTHTYVGEEGNVCAMRWRPQEFGGVQPNFKVLLSYSLFTELDQIRKKNKKNFDLFGF